MDDWKVKWSMARDEQPNSPISLHLSSSMHDPGTFSNMELDHTPKWFEWSKNLRLEFCKIFWIFSRMLYHLYVFCVFHTCFHISKLKICYLLCLLVNWPSFHQPLSFNYTKGPLTCNNYLEAEAQTLSTVSWPQFGGRAIPGWSPWSSEKTVQFGRGRYIVFKYKNIGCF